MFLLVVVAAVAAVAWEQLVVVVQVERVVVPVQAEQLVVAQAVAFL